ncbi:hypothetical protein [Ferrimonas marina]|uniref:Uncharacterized protein n=1 Tax=Ferrimonas marina TaxID=299255 RepID=A0A1M5ZPY8_9GAMM|nr:hypothetical protein [Ferrimonas marina]SHI26264.1 hypothetical protein SAMN02745129_0466 [Ferrimonas marina]
MPITRPLWLGCLTLLSLPLMHQMHSWGVLDQPRLQLGLTLAIGLLVAVLAWLGWLACLSCRR